MMVGGIRMYDMSYPWYCAACCPLILITPRTTFGVAVVFSELTVLTVSGMSCWRQCKCFCVPSRLCSAHSWLTSRQQAAECSFSSSWPTWRKQSQLITLILSTR